MLLVAVDTSGKNGSLALARVASGRPEVEIIESVALAGGTFSAQLVPQIAALLSKHGFSKSDLDAFAVVTGPGSFTGLRVGLAAIKALAEVLQKPVAAVSLLEAVAGSSPTCSSPTSPSSTHRRILAALDAGRQEIYVGDYDLPRDELPEDDSPENEPEEDEHRASTPLPHMRSERLLTRAEFLTEARANNKSIITPDAALADLLRAAGLPCELIAYPNTAVIARLGWQHIQRGQTVRPEDLEANYIRRSDAEIFSTLRR